MIKLTPEQEDFVTQSCEGLNIIYLGIHGSHLYGLNGDNSDIDIKGVYLPSKKDLLFGETNKIINKKNDVLNIEIEIKSITSFLKSLRGCDTNCIDMLHPTPESTLLTSALWGGLVSCRRDIYAKNMKGIIGYIKTHTKKYTNKIDRFSEMSILLEHIKNMDDNIRLKDSDVLSFVANKSFKYISHRIMHSDHEQPFLEVCGKKYALTWEMYLLKDALKAEINRYGSRTLSGNEKGMDTKSLSHALRVIMQLREIVEDKSLTFPLKHLDVVRKVKFGEVELEETLNLIDTNFEEVMKSLEESDLLEFSDMSRMLDAVEEYYFN